MTMRRRSLLIAGVTTLLLGLAAAAPVAAADPSCVGWFASTTAQADAREFAGIIREAAHVDQPFGRNTVAPFAHIALEDCQGD